MQLYFYSRFFQSHLNLKKLKKSHHGQDALACWARRPGELDRDANCILPSTQTDQDGSFASVGCVGPLKIP
jgi:hypothetical protein